MAAIMFVAIFTACKHEVPEIEPPPDTTWSESSVPRDGNITYFKNDVQKVLITKCAVDGYENSDKELGCHSSSFGAHGVVLDNYNDVHKEIDGKTDPTETDLWEAMTDKGMPEVGTITQEEAFIIRDWISEGSPNNECSPCNDYTAGSFRNSVAVILYKNCSGCHNADTKQAGFSFFRSNPSSPLDIDTTAVKNSSGLIIEAIVGISRSRMPKYIDPLYECEFDAIKTWIDNGMIID